MTKKEILAKEELDTYLGGLQDALTMTKAQIERAIKIIQEG